ncbi:hypothetical protein BDR03DRAFT_970921 [Suillus americanus]|nr:hypothetical protein BDR03DRAFT_970921 [Suillus americanus]
MSSRLWSLHMYIHHPMRSLSLSCLIYMSIFSSRLYPHLFLQNHQNLCKWWGKVLPCAHSNFACPSSEPHRLSYAICTSITRVDISRKNEII